MFSDNIWDYVNRDSKEYIIKWTFPKEAGSGKIWTITSPDDVDFYAAVTDVYIESPSYTKEGKIHTRGVIILFEDEAHIT